MSKCQNFYGKKQKDHINFSFKNLVFLIYPYPTKRKLLSFIASLYDPLLSIYLFSVLLSDTIVSGYVCWTPAEFTGVL